MNRHSPLVNNKRRFGWLFILPIAAWVLWLYQPSLSLPFVFDSTKEVKNNRNLKIDRLRDLGRVIIEPLYNSPRRMVGRVTFALQHYIHGQNAYRLRLVNVFFHLATGLFLFLLLRRTVLLSAPPPANTPERKVAAVTTVSAVSTVATLLWLVHPIQIQAIALIMQRRTVLAAMFFILSLYCYSCARQSQNRRRYAWLLACVLSGALSMLSKSHTAVLPLVIGLYEWFFIRRFAPLPRRCAGCRHAWHPDRRRCLRHLRPGHAQQLLLHHCRAMLDRSAGDGNLPWAAVLPPSQPAQRRLVHVDSVITQPL